MAKSSHSDWLKHEFSDVRTAMTAAEALALIRDSDAYESAGGVVADAWTRWQAANANEAASLRAFVDDRVAGRATAAPVLATKFGRGWVALIEDALGEPGPQTQPVTTPVAGAMVVNAGNCSSELLRQAGIKLVAPEITDANMTDLATARWDAFERGGFFVSRPASQPIATEASACVAAAQRHSLRFLVIDTESHKADIGGDPKWTEDLFAELRRQLGAAFVLYNVTFGIHSSPAVVNHEAFRRHKVIPIWEAYDGAGATLGVDPTAEKAAAEGWTSPHIAIGDKSIPVDADSLRSPVLPLGGTWLWAPEQAGDSVLALTAVLA